MPKVQRFFLEIKKEQFLSKNPIVHEKPKVYLDKEKDININKFFYRQIGKDHFWRDRLLWSDKEWRKYLDNTNLDTGIMKLDKKLIGFFEQEFHKKKNEIELIQMGILREYQGKKFGSFLLEYIIHKAFVRNAERVWVHTCSLDHKHALDNYLAKGFKIFKEETINFTF
ncbi:GNAT family N-acetyltransferase [Pelagibacteraceae bacterium]|jgi:GNAT superfamily N-acetyltransferase|nr:GNAT family N-acetyltransferase [Pelagibacteraceae bacterium]